MRRSAAAWQIMPLERGFGKSCRLLTGLSFLVRKRHPLANDGAAHLRFGHLDSLSKKAPETLPGGETVSCCCPGRLTAGYAAFSTGWVCDRRARSAQPQSCTVPRTITKPRFLTKARRLSVAAGFCASTQITSTAEGLRKFANQSIVASSA